MSGHHDFERGCSGMSDSLFTALDIIKCVVIADSMIYVPWHFDHMFFCLFEAFLLSPFGVTYSN